MQGSQMHPCWPPWRCSQRSQPQHTMKILLRHLWRICEQPGWQQGRRPIEQPFQQQPGRRRQQAGKPRDQEQPAEIAHAVAERRVDHAKDAQQAWVEYGQILLCANEFVFVD